MTKSIQEIRDMHAKTMRRIQIQERTQNAKMVVVGILVLSLFVFQAVGDENVKPFIWHWAAFMTALVVGCAIQDLLAARQIKREGVQL